MRARRQGRELALQVLYQCELNQQSVSEAVEHLAIWAEADEESRAFAIEILEGVAAHREELDARIAGAAEHWSVDRMAAVDRNILRIGAFELAYAPDTPPKVVINEAIELAKKFSTVQSGRFVNGLLDALRQQGGRHGDREERGKRE